MARNGGVLGAANIPTSTVASGIWTPNQIAQQIGGAASGLFWPTQQDAHFSSVVLLAHFDTIVAAAGSPNSAAFKDSSSQANHLGWTASAANATNYDNMGPLGSGKFARAWITPSPAGAGTHVFTTTGTSLTLGTGDFTIEGWFYKIATGATQVLFDLRPSSSTNPILVINTSEKIYIDPNGSGPVRTGTTTVTTNTWHHIHWTRASGVSYFGLDGAQQSTDYTDANDYAGNTAYIGCAFNSTVPFIGSISEARITKGFARYARTYTVPTARFPDY